jgi:hypothetical protein
MAGRMGLGRRIGVGCVAIGCLAVPAVAVARLPHPRTTLIVPGKSLAGVKLDMTKSQVFHLWGSTGCMAGFCTWQAPGNPGHAERATVSFADGKVIQVTINAGTSGTNEKFTPGQLSKWKTAKNIHLGSVKSAVKRAYPAAKANNSTGVAGFDLQSGIHFTRFSSFGVGATPDRLRYIELFCNSAGKC